MNLCEIKKTEAEILEYFAQFCRKENIRFFLSNGTLLGAVKYGGFIPWDDDVDVLVPRQDYDRLISIFEDSEKYRLFSHERNPSFRFPFAKLCDMTTRKEEPFVDNGMALGLDIDIFPLDAWPENEGDAKVLLRRIRGSIRVLNFAKLQFNHGKSQIRTIVKYVCIAGAKMVGTERPLHRIDRLRKSVKAGSAARHAGCVTWPVYGEREILPSELFAQTLEVTFEGKKYPAPIGYDAYLRSLYGNYEADPPEEEQCTHHSFKAYRL